MIYRTRILIFDGEFDNEGEIVEVAINLANVDMFKPSKTPNSIDLLFSSGEQITIVETFEKFCALMGIKQAVYDN